jgi:hypothetical protein
MTPPAAPSPVRAVQTLAHLIMVLIQLRQASQYDVSESLGVARAFEANNLNKLTSEDGLQAFVAVKVDRRIVTFDRCPRSVKSSLQNLPVKRVQFVAKRSEQNLLARHPSV